MKRSISALVAVILLGASGAAVAQTSAPTPAPASATEKAPQTPSAKDGFDKVICKTEPVTGSRLEVVKKCFTKIEWDELRKIDQGRLATAQYNADVMAPDGH